MILVGDSSETSDSGDDVTMMVDLQGHKVCGEINWENIDHQKVIEIPLDIDGMKVYFIKRSSCIDLLRRCGDGRPWKKVQERRGVDMKPSDSKTLMGHFAAQTQTARLF